MGVVEVLLDPGTVDVPNPKLDAGKVMLVIRILFLFARSVISRTVRAWSFS